MEPYGSLIPPFLLPSIIQVTVAFAALSFNSQNRNSLTPERRRKRVPKVVPFSVCFWSQFWPQKLPPKIVPKLVQKLIMLGSIFGSLFCWVLEVFGCPLGAFLGLLRFSWEASGPQKPSKTLCFLRFLRMQLFGSLKLLMALLGPSWPLLGPIWSQNGSQNGSKSGPESVQKLVQKSPPKICKNGLILGPQNGLQNGSRWRASGTGKSGRRFLKGSWSQDASKMAQDGLK